MKAVVIVAQEKFNNTEFTVVGNTLKENKIFFETASVSKSKASGYGSFSIIPDISIGELIVSDYDCLIIIGGSGCKKYLWKNNILHEKIQTAYNGNKILAAICFSPICLIYSGIINKSCIAAYKTVETLKIIKDSGNIYKDNDVCINGNIITASGPKASHKFCDAIINKLNAGEKMICRK